MGYLAVGAIRTMATVQPAILNRDMGANQWYQHFSREDVNDLGAIKVIDQQIKKPRPHTTPDIHPHLAPPIKPRSILNLPFETLESTARDGAGVLATSVSCYSHFLSFGCRLICRAI